MKNFFILVRIAFAFGVAIVAITPALAADTPSIPVIDVSGFIEQQKKLTDEQIQERNDMLKELKAVATLEQQRLSAQDKTPNTQATSSISSPSSSKNQKTSCDCDNPNDPYNYAQNFLYNASGEKVSRINPACQCKSSTQKDAPASAITPVNPIIPSPQKQESIDWKIQY